MGVCFQTTVDLSNICKESINKDFDPVAEYKKEREAEVAKMNKKYKYRRRHDPLVAKGFKTKKLVRRPNYLAKEKGVEFGPKRSDDVFRLRKQNTSRPPSMHVDDFVMLERAENDTGAARRKVCTTLSIVSILLTSTLHLLCSFLCLLHSAVVWYWYYKLTH